MKGTILDFLNLATEKPELAKQLVELAANFDFEFTGEELSDEDLESVSGGLTAMTEMVSENQLLALQQNMQAESRKYQTISNALAAAQEVDSNTINNMKA